MEYGELGHIGNPVDLWWNETRYQVGIMITVLREIPTADYVETVMIELDKAYQYLIDSPYPSKAAETRAYLLRAVEHLRSTLQALQIGDRAGVLDGYNMAYNRYVTVCRLLLERGIFEPVPRLKRRRTQ